MKTPTEANSDAEDAGPSLPFRLVDLPIRSDDEQNEPPALSHGLLADIAAGVVLGALGGFAGSLRLSHVPDGDDATEANLALRLDAMIIALTHMVVHADMPRRLLFALAGGLFANALGHLAAQKDDGQIEDETNSGDMTNPELQEAFGVLLTALADRMKGEPTT